MLSISRSGSSSILRPDHQLYEGKILCKAQLIFVSIAAKYKINISVTFYGFKFINNAFKTHLKSSVQFD